MTPRPPSLPKLDFKAHLGTGGYADVFLYEMSQPVQRLVAVKVLHVEDLDDDVQQKFETEANTMAQLSDHPYIVPVFWADVTEDGRPYIVMKYYPKPNMAVRARRGQFSVAAVLQLGIQVASAIETAHRAGIVHRDVKPANILTGQFGEPGLTDFGLAFGIANKSSTDAMSIPWSPPEVLFGLGEPDHRSDIYSLGATLWHLLSGKAPYEKPGEDNSFAALMRRVRDGPIPAIVRDDVPESLRRLLRQTLSHAPEGRPQSALTFAQALQVIEQEVGVPLTSIVVPEQPGVTDRNAPVLPHHASFGQRSVALSVISDAFATTQVRPIDPPNGQDRAAKDVARELRRCAETLQATIHAIDRLGRNSLNDTEWRGRGGFKHGWNARRRALQRAVAAINEAANSLSDAE